MTTLFYLVMKGSDAQTASQAPTPAPLRPPPFPKFGLSSQNRFFSMLQVIWNKNFIFFSVQKIFLRDFEKFFIFKWNFEYFLDVSDPDNWHPQSWFDHPALLTLKLRNPNYLRNPHDSKWVARFSQYTHEDSALLKIFLSVGRITSSCLLCPTSMSSSWEKIFS